MVRQTLAQEITQYLTEQGAAREGFADLHGVTGASLPYGITALVALPREIVGPLVDQPHRAYYDAYQAINVRLDAMAEGCAALLRAHGYQATANTEEHLPTGAEDRSPLPHKAVACRAGLGWIGKNNLLTTPDFGGAVRLCTVVTDAPLPTAEPILSSRCGSCRVCVDACLMNNVEIVDLNCHINAEGCCGCLECQLNCPTNSIQVLEVQNTNK